MQFHKYSATGNDFIVFDGRKQITLSKDQVVQLCHRRQGIGADGILILENSSVADYKMRIFNSDGSEGEMCGNGARALLHYAHYFLNLKNQTSYKFQTMNSVYEGEINGHLPTVKMTELYDAKKYFLPEFPKSLYVNTGVPHYVIEVNDIINFPVYSEGKRVRSNPLFPQGTNVDFFSYDEKNGNCELRTFERGVEDETYACGTGIVATAFTLKEFYNLKNKVKIKVKGGEVTVEFNQDFSQVYFTGAVELVFNGSIEIK